MLTTQLLTPHHSAWGQAAEQIGAITWPAGAALAKRMRTATWQPWERVVYATDGGALAGFCALLATDIVPDTPYSPFVSSVYVNPTYRGQGLSLKLVQHAENTARAAKIDGLYIVTRHVGLYEHLDYELVDRRADRFGRLNRILYKSLA
ncbi:GNAT family N-acetyltransferase [Levilactobacillus sp. HBUAS70063]|uniref:GNAT family N-acetyltransferase n=1 Tax=Levilactobacillus sp. HBUAS70063 TaxID=3109359 RepID=UPI00313341DF